MGLFGARLASKCNPVALAGALVGCCHLAGADRPDGARQHEGCVAVWEGDREAGLPSMSRPGFARSFQACIFQSGQSVTKSQEPFLALGLAGQRKDPGRSSL